MKMNAHNSAVAQDVVTAIAKFEARTCTLDEVQAALQSAVSLFENDGSDIAQKVRLAEADLEEVQFAILRDEQRSAAIFRLDALRAAIGATGSAKQVGDI